MRKSKSGTVAKIRGKGERPAVCAATQPQGELLPAEDTFEHALAAVKTERQRAFIRALVATWPQLDGKSAAVAAGCGAGAYQTAHPWRHQSDIRRAVNLWIRERLQNALPPGDATPEQQAEQLLRTAWLTARSSILWFTRISPDRTRLIPDFGHATDEMMSAIESFDITERVVGGDTVDRRIKLRLKDSGRALTLLARATGVEEKPQPANIQFNVVYRQTPGRLLTELATDETARPDEAVESMEPAKKFPIN